MDSAPLSSKRDGLVSVTNRRVDESGEIDEAEGVARPADPAATGKLEVSFVSVFGNYLFWRDYWIIGLGSDYDYALVATPTRRWGWILSRDRQPPRQLIEGWLQQFRDQGYDPSAFVLTVQSSGERLSVQIVETEKILSMVGCEKMVFWPTAAPRLLSQLSQLL